MASTDATPIPEKNVAYRVTFPIMDSTGALVTGAAGLDSEVSKDAGTFADCTNEATEIATASGMYYLDLTSTEMNADTVAIIVKTSTTDAKTTVIVLYPEEAGNIRVNVTQVAGTSQTARDIGASVLLSPGTGTGQLSITSGIAKVDVDTIKTNPVVNAGTITFPTTATLASTTNITAGTIATVTNLTNAPTNGDLTSTMKTSVTTAATAATPTAAAVTGAVGSVTAGVTVTTNNDKTGYALTSGERNSIADAALDRDMSTGADSGSTTVRTMRQALRFLRNKWSISAGTLTVTKEDDATSSWTSSVTTDASAVPVIGNDPAGP